MSTALVTGASSGIGRSLLPLFAADKHDLILVARRADLLEQQKRELEQRFGVKVTAIALDLAETGAAQRLFDQTGGDVDILVNNAGFAQYGLFHEQALPRQRAMIDVNVSVLTELTHLYLAPMVKRGRGRIMQVASTAAYQPGPRMAVYYATKAYVLSLSEALAYELAGTGVTVTALCPGPTKTEFMEVASYRAPPAFEATVMSSDDVARIGYRALMNGDRVAVAGLANRVATIAAQMGPRSLVLAVTDRLTRSRT
jgi:short-subunit dehydrogenase